MASDYGFEGQSATQLKFEGNVNRLLQYASDDPTLIYITVRTNLRHIY